MKKAANILIVDDEQATRETLRIMLESEEYRIYDCSGAEEARALLKQHYFAVLLVDIFLPDENGMDLAAELQEEDKPVQVIFITGSAEIELAQKALRLGVFDYLVKPVKSHQLRQVVQNAMMRTHLLEEQKNLEMQKAIYQEELEKKVKEQIARLKESESRYKSLVEQTLVGVCICQQNQFQYVNEKMAELLGHTPAALIFKKGMIDFVVDEQKEKLIKIQQRILEMGEAPEKCILNVITKNGHKRIFEMWAGRIIYKDAPAIECLVLDRTDQKQALYREKRLEMELLNEHKMAAIGQLAAGLSHNINTPISVIQGVSELIKLEHPEITEIEKILRQTARMTELVNSIQIKSRKELDPSVVRINLNKLVQDVLDFFNANLFFKHQVKKEIHLAENLPPIQGVYSDFSQSFSMILQNAIDAVYYSEQKIIKISTKFEKGFILINISDSGRGIKEENKELIFNPFFTTKPTEYSKATEPYVPRGTGLGLSQAHMLLSPYGIVIEFDSLVDVGTTFVIRIPTQEKDGAGKGALLSDK